MTLILKSNASYSGPSDLGEITVVSKTAAEIYSTHSSRVTADGGTVASSTRATNAITDAVNKGYYDRASLILSANFGAKTSGAGPVLESKLYNMASTGASQDGVCAGTVEHDTSTEVFATSFMNSTSLDSIVVTALPLCKNTNGNIGIVICGRWPTSGGQISFTTGGVTWAMLDYVGRMDIGTTKIAAAPDYAITSKDAVGIFIEQATGKCTLVQNGVVKKSTTNSFTPIAAGATADATIKIAAGTDWRLAELWYLNDATLDSIIQLTSRMDTDY